MILIRKANPTPKRIWKTFSHIIRYYTSHGHDYDIFCKIIANNLEEIFNIDRDYIMIYYVIPCTKIYG